MRGIDKLNPVVRVMAERLLVLCHDGGYPVKITETLRSSAEQDALYAQGRTAPGKIVTYAQGKDYESFHQWGLAFDFIRDVKGREYDNSDGFFDAVGRIGKSIGLSWGGDFKTIKGDLGHFQDDNHGTIKSLKSQWGTPELYLKSW